MSVYMWKIRTLSPGLELQRARSDFHHERVVMEYFAVDQSPLVVIPFTVLHSDAVLNKSPVNNRINGSGADNQAHSHFGRQL